ncbi:MAG: GGDEF domain-containing protein [Solirubrobacterales bacterium]
MPNWMLGLIGALALTSLAGFALWLRAHRRNVPAINLLATEDPVTGFANHDAFDRRFGEEFRRAKSFGSPLGMMALELDGFAEHAETVSEGELAEVLRHIAQVMRLELRPTDILARPAAGQFAVICPESHIDELIDLRSKLEHAFEADQKMNWEVNIGVAELEDGDASPTDLVTRADDALYSRQRAHKLVLVS